MVTVNIFHCASFHAKRRPYHHPDTKPDEAKPGRESVSKGAVGVKTVQNELSEQMLTPFFAVDTLLAAENEL